MTPLPKRPIAATAIESAAFAIVVAQLGHIAPVGGQGQHAVAHLGPGIAGLLLVIASRVIWPPPADGYCQSRWPHGGGVWVSDFCQRPIFASDQL
jgi:hypothetical protein